MDICTSIECAVRHGVRNELLEWIKEQSSQKKQVTLSVYDKLAENLVTNRADRTLSDIQVEMGLKALSAKNTVDSINIPKGKEDIATRLIADTLSKSINERLQSGKEVTLADSMVVDPLMLMSIQAELDLASRPTPKPAATSKNLEFNM